MYKFTFVILHYLTEYDTIDCVDSILNNVDYQDYKIIVVDNGSTNNSGETLLKRYRNNEKIVVIIVEENLGFARGHNIGYEYDDKREAINQWYQNGSPATSIRTEEDRIYLVTGNELDTKKEIDIGPITKDIWHTFVIHFIHSHYSDGLIELWHNGNKIITHMGGNMYDDVLPKWKIGLYKTAFEKGTSDVNRRIIFFDNIKVGNENAAYDEMIP